MKGPRTRASIIEAAGIEFSARGYEATTLEQVAARIGLTRSSVLFHFDSKRALLLAIVEPLFRDVSALLPAFEQSPVPLGPRQRRQLLARYCKILVTHRYAAILLVRDLTTVVQMDWPTTGPGLTMRMMRMLHGEEPSRELQLRASSAIGSILRPVCQPPMDPAELDEAAQQVIVNCALAAYAAKTCPL